MSRRSQPEETEESDEDMGYGLFDGDDTSGKQYPPNTSSTPPFSPLSKNHLRREVDKISTNTQPTASPQGQAESLLRRLIALQSFSGPWPSLASLPSTELHIDMNAARTAAKRLGASVSVADQILATALVITFLERKMPDEEDTWELVVEKARMWLQDTVEDGAVLAEVWRVAQGLVGA